jgi:hypothetical protein
VRPVREQLEHDRIIRLLQARYKRRFAVAINPGAEQNQGVGEGTDAVYPDLILQPSGRGRKLAGIIEVETQESVNNLEAIAQWAVFGRFPIEFAVYVPAGSVESARRLVSDNRIGVTEIWTYHAVGDQLRFTQVFKSPVEAKIAAARAAANAAAAQQREAERAERAARRALTRKPAPKKAPAKKASPPATKPAARPKGPAKAAAKTRKR